MKNEDFSPDKWLPEIRRDLQLIPVQDNGRKLIYFHDVMGYTPPDFALDAAVEPFLSLFTGRYTIRDLTTHPGSGLKERDLIQFAELLDEASILESNRHKKRSRQVEHLFEKKHVRESSLAGLSYPDRQKNLKSFLKKILSGRRNGIRPPKQALYAPHIDIRVGEDQYGEAFSLLTNLKPDKVLILGTSHYAGYHGTLYDETPFIGSVKEYQLPGRTFKSDHKLLKKLLTGAPENGFTLSDRAHRVEHSIETHLLFASAVWDHPFEIIPILVGSLDEILYHKSGDLADKTDRFTSQLRDLIADENTFTLISGDLSHVGRKFGDPSPASDMKSDISIRDHEFIKCAKDGSPESLLELLSQDADSSRICGFPPLFTYLKMFPK
ncbi:MAG: AmmeMemoRadiSam system protein B, partial [Balneolaceae bacterium]